MALSLDVKTASLVILAALLIQCLKYVFLGLRCQLSHVPGPWHTRFSGLTLKLATLAGRRIHHVHALHERYGPYVRISPTEVAVADPAGFKRIHALNSGFAKTKWYTDMTLTERQGVFSMPGGKPHADRRRLLSRPFSKSQLRQTWEPTVKQHVSLAVEKLIHEAGANGGEVDILKWWTLMTSDISAHLMFGESFHTLEKAEVSEYVRVLQNALKGGGIGVELPWLRAVGRHIPARIFQDSFNANATLMRYGEAAVRHMRRADGGGNIFANMMRSAEKGDERIDEKDVQVEATNLIVAGSDTTAITLTYFVWAVLARKTLHAELVAELQSLSDDYTDAELEALPLLNATIEETLRLYGAAPGGLPRGVPRGGVEIGGFFFPKGTTLTTQGFSLHRDAALFPNPHEFNPSRFLAATASPLSISPAARAVYSPFGAGARTCLGVHLAYMELRHGAAAFLRACGPGGASLAASTTEASMELENYFLVAPRAHRCIVSIAPAQEKE